VVIQLRDRLQGGFDVIRKFLSDGFKYFFQNINVPDLVLDISLQQGKDFSVLLGYSCRVLSHFFSNKCCHIVISQARRDLVLKLRMCTRCPHTGTLCSKAFRCHCT
jgi:hypothetical protein